mmetsp:Transcript_56101/g.149683  ORF Transcript_56101/g.149683 Transcript_56101/m.149683 type:complete len:308 (+) Transcript_56101:47-970(+)
MSLTRTQSHRFQSEHFCVSWDPPLLCGVGAFSGGALLNHSTRHPLVISRCANATAATISTPVTTSGAAGAKHLAASDVSLANQQAPPKVEVRSHVWAQDTTRKLVLISNLQIVVTIGPEARIERRSANSRGRSIKATPRRPLRFAHRALAHLSHPLVERHSLLGLSDVRGPAFIMATCWRSMLQRSSNFPRKTLSFSSYIRFELFKSASAVDASVCRVVTSAMTACSACRATATSSVSRAAWRRSAASSFAVVTSRSASIIWVFNALVFFSNIFTTSQLRFVAACNSAKLSCKALSDAWSTLLWDWA